MCPHLHTHTHSHTHTHTHTHLHAHAHTHTHIQTYIPYSCEFALTWVCTKSSTAEGGTESFQMSAPVLPGPAARLTHTAPLSPGSGGAQGRSKPCEGWDVIRKRWKCVDARIVLHFVPLLLTSPPPPGQGHRRVTSRTSRPPTVAWLGSQRACTLVPVARPLLLGFLLPRKGRNRALVMPACSTA